MNNQIVTVNLIPGLSTPAVVRVSQYDVGRPITFNILDGASAASISSSMTVTVVGTKPSGLGFSQSAVIASLSTVTINTTLAMTQECGMIPAEIRFTQSGENVGTANFILAVEMTPHAEGTTDGTYETMADLQTQLNGLDTRVDALEAGSGGSGLTDDIKTALLQIAQKVAYIDANGQDYYDDLYDALYSSTTRSVLLVLSHVSSSNSQSTVEVGDSYTTTLTASTNYTINSVTVTMGGVDVTSTTYSSGTVSIPSVTGNIVITATAVLVAQSITATYTQGGTVYDTDSLDSLKADLVVTANYSGGTSETVPVSDYTLSGTLTVGTSTITVSYAGLTDTFSVTVSNYGEDVLANATWESGNGYNISTGALVTRSGAYATEKFSVQDLSYSVNNLDTTNNTNYYIFLWDENDNYLGYKQNSDARFQWKPEYKIAVEVRNSGAFDPATMTMLPYDKRATAVSAFEIDIADMANDVVKVNGYYELNVKSAMAEVGVNSSNYRDTINRQSIIGMIDQSVYPNNFPFTTPIRIGTFNYGTNMLLSINVEGIAVSDENLPTLKQYLIDNSVKIRYNY